MNKRAMSKEAEGSDPSKVMINISVQQLVTLLQNADLSKSKKSPLTRAKSDPSNWAISSAHKRKSVPEIFIFPDVKENAASESSQNESESVSIDGQRDSDKSMKSEFTSSSKKHGEYEGKAEIMPLSLSYEERQLSCHGVSEVYFKNVVNELLKTKKSLKDLQMQHRLLKQDKLENDKLRQEIHRLRFSAQHLQREHRHLTEQNKKLKLKLSAYQPPGMNDSFELGTAGDMDYCHREVQTDLDQSAGHAEPVNIIFCQRMEQLRKENEELIQHYNVLKNSVKILNSCLIEEKQKNKDREKELSDKEEERKKIFSQLARRRQEYDELYQEHMALKKNWHLCEEERSYGSRSRHSSRSSGLQTSCSTGRNHSGDQLTVSYNIQPVAHSSLRREGSYGSGMGLYQNDLSSTENESAPSNIPFSGQTSSHGSIRSLHASGERGQPSVAHGTQDTQPHPPLECPTCLRIFHDDGSFLSHMTKCLPY